jgi:hypothetical protein
MKLDEELLAALRALKNAEHVVEIESLPSIIVSVRRQWNDQRTIDVPLSDLWDFHYRSVSGGIQVRLPRPFLHARMLCTSIPDGSDFPHSCQHGPPPHEILVCICKKDNKPFFGWFNR